MKTDKIGIMINGLGIGDDFPVRIMGILNLSEESFYKASVVGTESIAEQAVRMIAGGASILDIGGRSTAPHAGSISVELETERVVSALGALLDGIDMHDVLVSIDTQYVKVGDAAYELLVRHGQEESFMVNDVSCLATDAHMADWISEIRKPLVIMASHSVPGDSLGIANTLIDLAHAIDKLDNSGFEVERKLIIDPAIGRWIPEKDSAFDCELIAKISDFRVLGKPILCGISRKSFVGSVTGAKDPSARLAGSLSATAIAVFKGAHIVRTHDVARETMDTILVASAIRKAASIE